MEIGLQEPKSVLKTLISQHALGPGVWFPRTKLGKLEGPINWDHSELCLHPVARACSIEVSVHG